VIVNMHGRTTIKIYFTVFKDTAGTVHVIQISVIKVAICRQAILPAAYIIVFWHNRGSNKEATKSSALTLGVN
jgi:hypothetical protein